MWWIMWEAEQGNKKIWEVLFYVHVECVTCTKYSTIHSTGTWEGKNRDGSCLSEVALVCCCVVVVCLSPKYLILFKGYSKVSVEPRFLGL